jgi:hypothetical protein
MSFTSLKVRTKLTLIVGLLTIPLVILAILFVQNSTGSINFAVKERAGIDYQRSIWAAMTAIAAARVEPGSTPADYLSIADRLADKGRLYDEAFGTTGASREFSAALVDLGWPDTPVTAGPELDAAVGWGRRMMVKVADGSNITLDPDIDTYYVLYGLTVDLPGIDEHSGRLTDLVRTFHARPTPGAAERSEILVRIEILQGHLESLRRGLETAFDANGTGLTRDALERLHDGLERTLERHIDAIRAMAAEAGPEMIDGDMDVSGVLENQTDVVAATDALWLAAADEADRLLALRIAGQWQRLFAMLAAAGGITVLALVLTILVSREISRSLGRITGAVERIADDDLDVTVEGIDRLDEIGVMSRSVEVLRRNAAEAARAFGENLRIKVALDNASANVMVADTSGRIVYVNESGKALLRAAAEDLRTAIPGFDPDAVIGAEAGPGAPAAGPPNDLGRRTADPAGRRQSGPGRGRRALRHRDRVDRRDGRAAGRGGSRPHGPRRRRRQFRVPDRPRRQDRVHALARGGHEPPQRHDGDHDRRGRR